MRVRELRDGGAKSNLIILARAGFIVGAVIALIVAIVGLFWWRRRRNEKVSSVDGLKA